MTVLDHKWLDSNCSEDGCQSLVLKAEIARLRALLHGLLNADPEAEREARALLYGPVEAGST